MSALASEDGFGLQILLQARLSCDRWRVEAPDEVSSLLSDQ